VNKFNLTFSGKILPGFDPRRVKAAFGKVFLIDDAERIEKFFTGQTVILRRDLDRKAAGTLYVKLHKVGIDVALVKTSAASEQAELPRKAPTPKPVSPIAAPTPSAPKKRGMDQEIRESHPGRVDQSWPVSATRTVSEPKPDSKRTGPQSTTVKAQSAAAVQANAQLQATKQKALEEERSRREAEWEANRQNALKEERASLEAEQEAARQKALEEQRARLEAEQEAARQKALKEEQARLEAEQEAARQKALKEERARLEAEQDAARQKALEEERARLEAEQEAARQKALEEQRARLEAEQEAARQKALEEERARLEAEQVAARQKALEEERARLEAEQEAARQKALKEELARKKAAAQALAELRAQEKALKAEARRKAAEQAAIEKALKQQARKKAAEQAAHLRAERADQRRKEAEDKAQVRLQEKQKKEEQRALLRAEQARVKATLKAALKAEQQAEHKRQAAEESERQMSLALEEKRSAADDQTRIKQQQAEEKRVKEDQRRKHEEEFARLKLEKAAEKARREAEALATRVKADREASEMAALQAEQRRLEAEHAARIQAENLAQLEAQRAAKSAAETARLEQAAADEKEKSWSSDQEPQIPPSRNKPIPHSIGRSASVRTPVKTTLKVPAGGKSRRISEQVAASPSRRPGSPNFFNLRPFRNTAAIRKRADDSRQLKQIVFAIALLSFIALAGLSARYLTLQTLPPVAAASAVAVNLQSELLLVAGERLLIHDRAGVGSEEIEIAALGLTTVPTVLIFNGENELLVPEQGVQLEGETGGTRVNQCSLVERQCQLLQLPDTVVSIDAMVADHRTGSIYLADAVSGKLLKTAASGELIATVTVEIPSPARLRLQFGLIYMNSAQAPAISVFRPDDQAFGQQLDEILLMPSSAAAAGHSRVADFLRVEDSWWATLYNPETLEAGVYRFDLQWNYLNQIELTADSYPEQLVDWAGKVLIFDSKQPAIQRFNASGQVENPLLSASLQAYINAEMDSATLKTRLWRLTLGLLTLVTVFSLCLGSLLRLRSLVYHLGTEQGAEPLSELEQSIQWITPAGNADRQFKRLTTNVAVTLLGLLIILSVTTKSLLFVAALGIWIIGPAIALFLLHASRRGHVGRLEDKLLLVDHNNSYHLGRGPRILYRKDFLMIDDVVVFIGTSFLPSFDPQQLAGQILPLAAAGIKVDRKTVMIKLLQGGHPLAKGAMACMTSTFLATLVLLFAW
jgi:hypothetical protein